jgi:hypothetical protein
MRDGSLPEMTWVECISSGSSKRDLQRIPEFP